MNSQLAHGGLACYAGPIRYTYGENPMAGQGKQAETVRTGGVQPWSAGEMFPWTIVYKGDRMFGLNADTGQKTDLFDSLDEVKGAIANAPPPEPRGEAKMPPVQPSSPERVEQQRQEEHEFWGHNRPQFDFPLGE